MKAEEYEEFLSNPADFVIRKYLPRVFGILESFETLPEINSFIGLGGVPQKAHRHCRRRRRLHNGRRRNRHIRRS